MVLFFTSSEGYVLYMGADKYENEELIKYGLPEDIWFHVDDMSSAHVYLRMNKNQRIDELSEAAIMECAQLVKANSIEGCKLSEVYVVYTPWANLHKTNSMEVGAIGFHNKGAVRRMKVCRDNSIVKILNKTKTVSNPNLAELQAARDLELRADQKAGRRLKVQQDKEAEVERRKEADLKSYSSLMSTDKMVSNAEISSSVDNSAAKDFEEDFM